MHATIDNSSTQEKTQLSMPRLLLHSEGFFVFALALFIYWNLGASWWLFAALLLVPDLAFIAYAAAGNTVGAIVYNAAHTYIAPIILGVIAFNADWQLGMSIATIWLAHIGMDRTVGYGLKYASSFHDTHIKVL